MQLRETLASRPVRALAATTLVASGLSFAIACFPDNLGLSELPPSGPDLPVPACGDGVIAAAEACDPGDAGDPGCTPGCAIECPPGGFVDPDTRHCYFVSSDKSETYTVALSVCGFAGGHVVTLGSAAERDRVHAWRGEAGAAPFWVGLSQSAGLGGYQAAKAAEPGWRSGCAGCFAAVPSGATDIPLVGDAGGCVVDGPDASTYVGEPCDVERLVVCEREPPGSSIELLAGGYAISVPRGGGGADAGPARFFYVPVPVTADEAREGCAGLGQLAIFDSARDREAVMSEIQRVVRAGDEGVWIGLANDGGAFFWDDGVPEAARPSVWGHLQPVIDAGPARAAAKLPAPSIDVQLAQSIAADQRRPYVCGPVAR